MPDLDRTALVVVDVQQAFEDASYWGRRNNPDCEVNVAALRFRRAIHQVLDGWRRDDEATEPDVRRIATMIASGNARRLYHLSDPAP